jgi:hypothetical protein
MRRGGFAKWLERLWLAQAIYYLVSGIWPLVGIRSFQAVTGPKADLWLVKTVGALITVVGAGLALAGVRRRVTPEVALIAGGSGVALATVDVVYVARRRISPVYLLDALAELVIVGGWILALRRDLIVRR